jgi:probable addiction module antidote protein
LEINPPWILFLDQTYLPVATDAAYICTALDTIARAKGMSSVAKETGLSRESLYKSFSGSSKPEFETVRKVLNSFGVKLVVEPAETKAA